MNRREAIKAAVAGISAQAGIEFTGELLTRNDDDICIVVELATSMTLKMKQNIRESLSEFLNCGIPVVVLPEGAKMRVVRRSDAECDWTAAECSPVPLDEFKTAISKGCITVGEVS